MVQQSTWITSENSVLVFEKVFAGLVLSGVKYTSYFIEVKNVFQTVVINVLNNILAEYVDSCVRKVRPYIS